jgi:hypothetical protein
VTERHQELWFGAAAETAFETVRATVDARIAELVPEAPGMLAAAFENAASNNPEHWAGAAATCRRQLKTAADSLRPPGPDVSGRKMTDAHYINRLVDWIVQQSESETGADFIVAELEYLGRRLDAVDDAGHKGAHATVSRLDAASFLTGTYLALGDVLVLAQPGDTEAEVEGTAVARRSSVRHRRRFRRRRRSPAVRITRSRPNRRANRAIPAASDTPAAASPLCAASSTPRLRIEHRAGDSNLRPLVWLTP